MVTTVRIVGTGQLIELQRRLRAAGGPRLQQNLNRRIRRAAEPTRDALQAAIRTTPIRGTGSATPRRRAGDDGRAHRDAGLRETIARAIRISVRTGGSPGARIYVDRSRLPADQRSLPERIDEGRWRHPVFGNRSKWTTQYGRPWWGVTVRRMEPHMRREVVRVLDDVESRLRG